PGLQYTCCSGPETAAELFGRVSNNDRQQRERRRRYREGDHGICMSAMKDARGNCCEDAKGNDDLFFLIHYLSPKICLSSFLNRWAISPSFRKAAIDRSHSL